MAVTGLDAQDPDDLGTYFQEPGDQMLHTQEPSGHDGRKNFQAPDASKI